MPDSSSSPPSGRTAGRTAIITGAGTGIGQGNVSDPSTAKRVVGETVEAFGAPDVLVNNSHSFLPSGGVAPFMASQDSRYVTGQTIHADGGM